MIRNIVVFEVIREDAAPVLDWRLQGQALPVHSCPVAMVSDGQVMQWEAQEFDFQTVRKMALRESGNELTVSVRARLQDLKLPQWNDRIYVHPDEFRGLPNGYEFQPLHGRDQVVYDNDADNHNDSDYQMVEVYIREMNDDE